jgi:hypothetical protein
MDASKLMWRPPYPSENLKTARFAKIAKTYSTTNPYATQEDEGPQCSQPAALNEFQNLNFQQSQQSQQSQHSKRENNSNKIYERGLTPQVGMNPFLQGNYLQDLDTQNEFLKPINSNGAGLPKSN